MKAYRTLIEALEEFGKENVEEVLTGVYHTASYANLLKVQKEVYEGKRKEVNEVNRILAYVFNNWGKDPFNGLIIRWVDKFLQANGKTLKNLGDNPISRVINYHALVTREYMGNEALEVKVSEDESGVIDIVMKNCPYTQFCEETGHRKCIRGTVLKYILEGTGIIAFLEKKDNKCYLKLREATKAVDELIDTIKEEAETGKKKDLHML